MDFKSINQSFIHSFVPDHLAASYSASCALLQDMDPHHQDNMTSMNLNKYPSTEGHTFPKGAQRIWSHTDYEALTLLFQKPGDAAVVTALFQEVPAVT